MVADQILSFYRQLALKVRLPKGVEYMNPYQDNDAFVYTTRFYRKFYNDTNIRRIILGINPGRFGGGITGVPFTDPLKLDKVCGIDNPFQKKAELSADFIYQMIEGYGGPEKFYRSYVIGALSPLGFVKDGKNLNYYDIPKLAEVTKPFMVDCLRKQSAFGVDKNKAFCLGEGDNYRFLQKLNEEHQFFQEIIPLPHPRFIMQYKRKQLQHYIDLYLDKLNS